MSYSASFVPGIQFMSDLHLERIKYNYEIPQVATHLALVGDIGRFCDFDGYASFLKEQCAKFDQVLLVAGNNEFHGSSRDRGLDAAQKLAEDPSMHGKLVFMNRTRVDLIESNTIVLGCTLHSHIGPNYTKLTNDFERVENWTIQDHNDQHKLDVAWLQQTLDQIARTEPGKQVVILTHYAPSFENTCHPMHENNAVSQCFCSNTLDMFKHWKGNDQVTDWVFGHTHWNSHFMCGTTLVRSNCLPNQPRNLSWWRKLMIYRPFDERAVISVRSTRSWSSLLLGT